MGAIVHAIRLCELGRSSMAKIEMLIDSIRQELLYYHWVVILKEKLGERLHRVIQREAEG